MVKTGLMSTRGIESGIDINYPDINFYDVDLDNRYLPMDIFYPKSTK